jgi:hypothetical protein
MPYRYRVASDTLANRPKAVGLAWHRLRANVACLVDWLRIAVKNGWLGSARAALRQAGIRTKKKAGHDAAMSVAKTRARLGPVRALRSRREEERQRARDAATAPAAQRPTAQLARPAAVIQPPAGLSLGGFSA